MDVKELMQDEEFLSRIEDAEDLDAVMRLFASKGVAVSEEAWMKYLLPEGEELNEDELTQVAGGAVSVVSFIKRLRAKYAKRKRANGQGGSFNGESDGGGGGGGISRF